jgi:hypothetical protein
MEVTVAGLDDTVSTDQLEARLARAVLYALSVDLLVGLVALAIVKVVVACATRDAARVRFPDKVGAIQNTLPIDLLVSGLARAVVEASDAVFSWNFHPSIMADREYDEETPMTLVHVFERSLRIHRRDSFLPGISRIELPPLRGCTRLFRCWL